MDSGILTQHYTIVQASIIQYFPQNCDFIHTVDCGAPLFPPNSTNTIVSGTTEGAMATFQCEEGLIPLGPTTSTCADTEQTNTPGQWLPNPADIHCTDIPITGAENIINSLLY